eukprot:CAMPEP_0118677490 /NCGR_PEP_ID=MMETSP0800-20121206/2656_1 /TAXON_ID=210618 ORGANISM="Striatella unipunctata, Strain CCMP2910" /NCGR_SAMPLE_ID=MMETSP0800 /ASSEMBLY_ACC=CAM_ASM_000638 /LENGTH=553 /DNA_ID=CAMNT_0006573169 /DNA_START=84 /DNA_END=1745 /DNA_ORIENTATION=+
MARTKQTSRSKGANPVAEPQPQGLEIDTENVVIIETRQPETPKTVKAKKDRPAEETPAGKQDKEEGEAGEVGNLQDSVGEKLLHIDLSLKDKLKGIEMPLGRNFSAYILKALYQIGYDVDTIQASEVTTATRWEWDDRKDRDAIKAVIMGHILNQTGIFTKDSLDLAFTLKLAIKNWWQPLWTECAQDLQYLADWAINHQYDDDIPKNRNTLVAFVRVSLPMAKANHQAMIRSQNLPSFSGKDEHWIEWKAKALSVFRVNGMYQVCTNQTTARADNQLNGTLHGLLSIAIEKNSGADFCVETAKGCDGYQAWQNLIDFYENHHLAAEQLAQQTEIYQKLRLADGGNLHEFLSKFMRSYLTIERIESRLDKLDITCERSGVTDWRRALLTKIKDKNLTVIKSRLMTELEKEKETTTLPYIIAQLKQYHLSENKGKKPTVRGKPKYVDSESDDEEELDSRSGSEEGTAPSGKGNNNRKHMISQVQTYLNNACGGDEKKKAFVKELLSNEPASGSNGKNRRKRLRAKQAARKRQKAAKQDDDGGITTEEACAIFKL